MKHEIEWKDETVKPKGHVLMCYNDDNGDLQMGLVSVVYPAENEPKKYAANYHYMIVNRQAKEMPETYEWADLNDAVEHFKQRNGQKGDD